METLLVCDNYMIQNGFFSTLVGSHFWPIYNSSYMFDWQKAFKISKMTFCFASGIFVSAVISNSDVGNDYFEWIVARPGYEVIDNFIRAYMRVNGYIAWVSLGVTILSFIS